MKQYNVTGMSCAACSARVEKAVSAVDGVTSCSVNLLTNSMTVEGRAGSASVIAAVEKAGYGAEKKGASAKSESTRARASVTDNEFTALKNRLLSSLIFLAALMYFSMGHMMWDFPLPSFFDNNHVAVGLVQLLLAAAVMIINRKFFISGFKGLLNKAPNMDTLVALGSGASFIYSTSVLFAMTGAQASGNSDAVMSYMHELYFESAAMILALITVGKMLEARSKGKTTDALKSLMELAPQTAIVLKNGEETEISASDIQKGDIFIVKPGGSIPADGIIIDGHCAVCESALTGESIPVDKTKGDYVSAATVNQSGYIKCEAVKVGEETALSQIIRLVSDAAATKPPIAKAADKVSGVFVPFVIVAAAVTLIVWLICGKELGFALARSISVLVISCPCALGLATPVAVMVGNGMGAKNGILFKNAAALESAGKLDIIALDKTGTITKGEPEVTDVIPVEFNEDELISLAYSLEAKSEHPLAKAIVKYAESHNSVIFESDRFEALPGNGLSASIDGSLICGGNLSFISTKASVLQKVSETAEKLAREGKTPLFFSKDNSLIGIIAVADGIKSDSAQAIDELKNMGLRIVMLTGDNETTANAVREKLGIDDVIAGVLPDGKEKVIRNLQNDGHVAMVGDGINDAPALTSADVGIAIGAGTDVAIDAADVVLMKSSLTDVPAAIRLSRATLRNIHENLFWAFIYNIIGIPLAAGVWIPIFGWQLNPMFGAAAMSLSSFCVVSNALRLNLCDIRSAKRDRKKFKHNIKKEKKSMEKKMEIEGMMCMHCEARVKKALEVLDGVTEAVVSHEENSAVVKMSKDIPADALTSSVEEQGYKVLSVK